MVLNNSEKLFPGISQVAETARQRIYGGLATASAPSLLSSLQAHSRQPLLTTQSPCRAAKRSTCMSQRLSGLLLAYPVLLNRNNHHLKLKSSCHCQLAATTTTACLTFLSFNRSKTKKGNKKETSPRRPP